MRKENVGSQAGSQVAVRCNQCMRIVAYKVATGTGRIRIKCPKCGKEMIIDLSLRRTKGRLFCRRAAFVR